MTTGVVLMAYGTPASRAEILPYYTDIRRGRPPSAEQLADLTARYAAIGGLSPLAERTSMQRDALAEALGVGYHVELGMKHSAPSIESAVATLSSTERIVGLVLAPHYSALSVGQYHERAAAASTVPYTAIDSWATEPAFIDFFADEVSRKLAAMPAATTVVFTAHSLPQRVQAMGDPYPEELRASAEAVAAAAGLERWTTAWQSAGRTAEPWLGPDILEVVDRHDGPGLLVAAVGFVADHLEVLYDLDVAAAQHARARGMAFDRCACVNADPRVFAALAARVAAA